MFQINEDKSIYLTRGDVAVIKVTANGGEYTFTVDEIVRFNVFEKKDCGHVVLKKDVKVQEETKEVAICLEKEDTKIGELISKPKDYWYEIELNPDTEPQTIVGYDKDGPKVLRLFPEGDDV